MKDFFKMVAASAVGFLLANMIMFVMMFIGIIIFSAVLFVGEGVSSDKAATSVSKNTVLFLNVEGSISERQSSTDIFRHLLSEEKPAPISLFELNETLKLAVKDKKIKGIYLRLRWAGSGWGKINTLREMLSEFKKSKKFIYAYSEAYDEKLYFLATIADKIYMYPKGEFNWDGLDQQSTFFQKTLAKLDVEPVLIRAGRFKAAGETFIKDKMSAENKEQMSEITNNLWSHIEETVAGSRKKVSKELLNEWADKVSVVKAQDAYNLGLVDRLAPIEEIDLELKKASGTKADDDLPLMSWDNYYDLNKPKGSILSSNPHIAVIVADGEILMGSGASEDNIYSDELSSLIREVSKDEDVKAVVLRINSPGGSALASDVIWRSLEYLKKKKIVVSSFSDVAASGGYYIAANSNYIYADPMTITGSIGVFGLLFNTQKFFDNKLGVTFDGVKTHTSSDMMSGTRELTPGEIKIIQNSVDDIYHTFVSVVKEGRPKFEDLAAVTNIAEGRVWSGIKAKEIGLIDDYGTLETAITKAAELAKIKSYDVSLYPREKKFLDSILDSLGGVSFLPSWIKTIFMKNPNKINSIYYTRLPYDVQL
jgi:protease IV